jgi:hypothetical protein
MKSRETPQITPYEPSFHRLAASFSTFLESAENVAVGLDSGVDRGPSDEKAPGSQAAIDTILSGDRTVSPDAGGQVSGIILIIS